MWCLCVFYLSWLIGNLVLAINVLEWFQDLCSSQIRIHLLNFLQSLLHGLLIVLHTLTVIRKMYEYMYKHTHSNRRQEPACLTGGQR